MKCVLITGVCGGMGGAAARCLLEKGYAVFGLDKGPECGLPISYFPADLTCETDVLRAYREISKKTDHLDGILHFAGFYTMNSLVEISETDFVRIFNVNLFATYRVNKAFFPLLRPGSRIIMTSSELAPLDPLPFTGLYAVTKTAVEKYAYSLRMELRLHHIDVSVIRPGAVQTNMLGASTAALDNLCRNTKLYSYNADRFRRIVNSVETRNIAPEKIARIAEKALTAKRPKYIYNINRNILLRLLNFLPCRWQVAIISGVLKNKNALSMEQEKEKI